MKKRKILYTLVVSIILIVSSLIMTGTSYAATNTFGLQEYRKPRTDGSQYGYKYGEQKVWKVIKYDNSGTTIDYDTAVYCLRAAYGFYTETPGQFQASYNASYDFRKIEAMPSIHSDLNNNYKSVLWILDHAYVSKATTAATDRATLLANAGIPSDSEITDDDIDVIQQLAIWYYTNASDSRFHKDFAGEPNLLTLQQSVQKSGVQGPYNVIDDVNQYRYADIELLYKYLVMEAGKSENLTQYKKDTSVPPVTLATTNPTAVYDESTSKYILGPYKFDKNNTIPYELTAKFTDQNGKAVTNYTLLNSSKQSASGTINDLVGQEFYISMSKDEVEKILTDSKATIKLSFSETYRITNMTYWTINGDNTAQPLVVIDKTPKSSEGSISVNITVEKKYFDLSLRKFISAVNNQTVNRAPVVDVTKLANGTSTTATYNHSKTPVAVKKGDIVTYTIRVYNEGNMDGYVGKITDYLPEELEFINDLMEQH